MKTINFAIFAVAAAFTGTCHAALHDRGGGLIYDDVLNITWLKDANFAKTSGYDTDGVMSWSDASTWAANLVYGGYGDWRLPKVLDADQDGCNFAYQATDCGYNVNIATGEMAHLWYVDFGNLAYRDTLGNLQAGYGLADNPGDLNDESLFLNLTKGGYWSGIPYGPNPNAEAWYFVMDLGLQDYFSGSSLFYAWAVRDGDSTVAVPEPETAVLALMALMGMGMGLVGGKRRNGNRSARRD